MTEYALLLPIIVPLAAGALIPLVPKGLRWGREAITLLATGATFAVAVAAFGKELDCAFSWLGFGIDFSLRLYHFSGFIMLAAAAFSVLIALYSVSFMRERTGLTSFYSYLLLTLACVNGAVLSDNLALLLFFWEGLLITLFGMIAAGNRRAFRTSVKALTIVGIADVGLMVGMVITAHLAGTLTISRIHLAMTPAANIAFILMMAGAISKAGAMPFHSWIPDAAVDSPLPFMAFVPAALEKLLGIYLLARICLDIFAFTPKVWLSPLLMTVGCLTIILAVMMALIQKDYKKLLSYHAISQVGYMVLGIGTGLPVGIAGGIFHMLNHAMYKCCLFLTGGSVEKQAGTTDLEKLGGLGALMPVTCGCFLVAAASISGVPPFNGFFSKELVYDAALERGAVFYAAALAGSFLTAASFLKLGHAVYFGRREKGMVAKESPLPMLIPMITLAAGCILFGVYNSLPLKKFIQPILGVRLEGHHFTGMPANLMLVVATIIVLVAAALHHIIAAKMKGSGVKAADHIHYAPVLSTVYGWAEKGFLDPYNIGLKAAGICAGVGRAVDRVVDWVYSGLAVWITMLFSGGIRRAHGGNYAVYLVWSLIGAAVVLVYIMKSG